MTPAWFVRVIVEGDEGDDVLIVQRKLGAPMTGVYDQNTMARVRGLQKRHGLEESGMTNEDTAGVVGEKESKGQVPEWYTRSLSEGASGKDVAALRIALKQPNLPDYFDKDLGAAVRRFQSAVGLKPTGKVSRATAVALGDRTA